MAGFEDLEVWKEAMRLAERIYIELRHSRDFGLRDQMQRAAVSIPSNIAEGYERQSNKEFIQFLHVAKGSCGELRTQLILARNLQAVSESAAIEHIETTRKISAMLTRLADSRRTESGGRGAGDRRVTGSR